MGHVVCVMLMCMLMLMVMLYASHLSACRLVLESVTAVVYVMLVHVRMLMYRSACRLVWVIVSACVCVCACVCVVSRVLSDHTRVSHVRVIVCGEMVVWCDIYIRSVKGRAGIGLHTTDA